MTRVTAGGKIALFSEVDTVFDSNRGRCAAQPSSARAGDTERLDWLSIQLRESAWARATRVSYNAWWRTWAAFAKSSGAVMIPADEGDLARFLTFMTLRYSAGVVQTCLAATRAIHRLNSAFWVGEKSERLTDILRSVRRNGIQRAQTTKGFNWR